MSKKNKREKEKKTKGKNLVKSLRESILNILNAHPGRGYSAKQLVKKLQLKKKDDIKQATIILYQLQDEEVVRQLSDGSFAVTNPNQK